MKKIIKRVTIVCSVLLVLWSAFWLLLNEIILPNIVVPLMKEYIGKNFSGDVKLSFSDISYHPFRGFLLHNLKLSGPVALNGRNEILDVELIDLDIAFLPLIYRTLEIRNVKLKKVDLNIGRDSNGIWNFQPVVDMVLARPDIKFGIVIKRFNVMSGWIDYMDYYAKGNMFERRFYDVNVSVTNPSGPVYQLNLSGRGKQRSDESISLTMNYNHSNRSAAGLASINTKYLTEYWDYYLDDIFRPWNLKAKNVAVSTMFSYKKGELVLNGRYSVDDGILSHGDLSVKCDMAVEHNINYVKSAPEKCVARIKASIKDISSSSGEHVFLKDARCTAYITHREVFVRGLEGLVLGQPANMGGIFLFKPKELYVHGSLASLYNKLYLKVKSENKAIFGCRAGFGGSWLKAFANVTDLRDMAFEANTECSINLGDVPLLFKSLEKIHLSGNVNFSGYIKGEMDDFSSLNGAATLGANNISMLDVSPVSFNVKADIKKGLLSGDIPRTGFYEGDLYGALKADPARWGAQLNIDRLDLTEFFKNDQKLEGIKGVFDGNLSCVSEWKDIHSASGGGYFKLSDCDMRKTPLFSSAEEGIKGVVNGFIMPNFTKITGNFDIADGYISTQRVLCQSVTMTLNMNGKYSFSGDTTFNVGVRFLSKGLLGAARIILAPQTLGIDLLASTLNIKITGKWPGDLKQQTEIQPMAWMAKVFDPSVKISVYKCTLDKLWNKKQSR